MVSKAFHKVGVGYAPREPFETLLQTSYPYLSYPQTSEQSIRLLRTRLDKIQVKRKRKM